MEPYENPRCKGWGQLMWGPYISGIDRLSESSRVQRDTPDNKARVWALRILGGAELVPGINIPIAAADRCWLRNKCLIGNDTLPAHVVHGLIVCCMPCIEWYVLERKKKED